MPLYKSQNKINLSYDFNCFVQNDFACFVRVFRDSIMTVEGGLSASEAGEAEERRDCELDERELERGEAREKERASREREREHTNAK